MKAVLIQIVLTLATGLTWGLAGFMWGRLMEMKRSQKRMKEILKEWRAYEKSVKATLTELRAQQPQESPYYKKHVE